MLAIAVAGCGGSSSTGGAAGTSTADCRPACAGAAALPSTFQLAAELPTAVSHHLGRVGFRCKGRRRQLAVTSSGATEFVRFYDGGGAVRLAGDLSSGVARGPILRSLRQSVQVILAVEPGTAVATARVTWARAPCEVSRLRLAVDSASNLSPRSARARRLARLARLALKPHRNIGSRPRVSRRATGG